MKTNIHPVSVIKGAFKRLCVPLIYRHPPFGLQPERLAVFLRELRARASHNGDIAEVGCNMGGTAVIAYKLLIRCRWKGTYTCFDTFSGFVPSQFKADIRKGTPRSMGSTFSANSVQLVRAIHQFHGVADIVLRQGDIVSVSPASLANNYSVVLLDLDLSEPTYSALRLFYPLLAPWGIILVDDCPESSDWKARSAVERFSREMSIPVTYEDGVALVTAAGS